VFVEQFSNRDSADLVEACIFFIEEYDFDMDSLPEKLGEEVHARMLEDAFDKHCENQFEVEKLSSDLREDFNGR